jgi:hypothetical protein
LSEPEAKCQQGQVILVIIYQGLLFQFLPGEIANVVFSTMKPKDSATSLIRKAGERAVIILALVGAYYGLYKLGAWQYLTGATRGDNKIPVPNADTAAAGVSRDAGATFDSDQWNRPKNKMAAWQRSLSEQLPVRQQWLAISLQIALTNNPMDRLLISFQMVTRNRGLAQILNHM